MSRQPIGEGPEVVAGQDFPLEQRAEARDKYFVPPLSRFNSPVTHSPFRLDDTNPFDHRQKPSDATTPSTAAFSLNSTPRLPPAPAHYEEGYNPVPLGSPGPRHSPRATEHTQGTQRRAAYSLLALILALLIGLLIGGGIGGGVGGAIAANNQAQVKNLQSSLAAAVSATQTPSATSSAPSCQSTVVIDPAGCPAANNSTFEASIPGWKFTVLCSTNIQPMNVGGDIDISSSAQPSLDACLDACAAYNQNNNRGGCLGATWVIFSPTAPTQNSMCFLKNSTGVAAGSTTGMQVASGLLQSS